MYTLVKEQCTKEMEAGCIDLLTKVLPRPRLARLRNILGLRLIIERTEKHEVRTTSCLSFILFGNNSF